MQKFALPLAACLLALVATGAQAQSLWKWRDASGQLHISDTAPPAGTPAKNIVSGPAGLVNQAPALTSATSTPPAAPAAAAAPDKPASSAADIALDRRKKAADQEKSDKDKADRAALDARNAAIRKENCTRAQSSMATLQSGVRVGRTNANGEREILDDAGRAEEIKHAQDAIASSCGAAPAAQ